MPQPSPPPVPLIRTNHRPASSHKLNYRWCVTLGIFVFAILPAVLGFFIELDTCAIERPVSSRQRYIKNIQQQQMANATITASQYQRPSVASNILATRYETPMMIVLLLTCCFLKCLPASNSHFKLLETLKILLAYMWYMAAYFACNALKSIIGDRNCNTHSNSVSGHYLFHIYTTLTLLHVHAAQVGSINQHHVFQKAFWERMFVSTVSKLFMFFYICYAAISGIILMNTYYYGYHSIRQIIYGSLMALVVHLVLIELFELIEWLCIAQLENVNRYSPSAAAYSHSNKTTYHFHYQSNQKSNQLLNPQQMHDVDRQKRRFFSHLTPMQRMFYYLFLKSISHSERHGYFYIFPVLFVLICQIGAFVLLLHSGDDAAMMWRVFDIIVILICWGALGYLYVFEIKLPLPKQRKMERELGIRN